ncbi:hypothetical protein [Nonomuraea sediminis]|uniref:hypothetical protein n=1 Tax=Nonomuraea sediminis TaxID=2835864 RepID=UPI001BDC8085|nr:hypothetical protein [Nonomuraea sediminis]
MDNRQLLDLAERITANLALDPILIKTRAECERDDLEFFPLDTMELLSLYRDLTTVARKTSRDVILSRAYPYIQEDGRNAYTEVEPELAVNCMLTAAAQILALREAADFIVEEFIAIYRIANADTEEAAK